MIKRILLKTALLLLAAAVLGFAWHTQARWATTVSIKDNNLRTGLIAMAVNPTESWLSFDGLVPGQQIERSVTINNTGTSPIRLTLTAKKSAGYTTVFNGLICELIAPDQQTIFRGSLTELNQTEINPRLEAAQAQNFVIRAFMPLDAPDDLTDSYVNVTFELVGEQV